jgi:hypothetical protein
VREYRGPLSGLFTDLAAGLLILIRTLLLGIMLILRAVG